MIQSPFSNRDNRTTHEYWCDIMVKRASNPKRVLSVKDRPKEKSISNYEIKKLLEGLTF